MAICETHYCILRILVQRGIIPQRPSVLQIGEINYYEDFPLERIQQDIDVIPDEARQADIVERLKHAHDLPGQLPLWVIARIMYDVLFQPTESVAIDFNGPSALRLDLNLPIDLKRQFDVVFNSGTAEHVFDIATVFRTMHRHCRTGGIMFHEMPICGWLDHGFYNPQPTLYYDVASANGYSIEFVAVEEVKNKTVQAIRPDEGLARIHALARDQKLPADAILVIVFRKQRENEFQIPLQAYYDSATEAIESDWVTMRG